ncbi:hypothetical protein FRB94_007217 [Tulasnella sp. JGI-2019a]|nr:hypothetical protein FRB94_007217 [Tulasnella sp. JGI-2019a]
MVYNIHQQVFGLSWSSNYLTGKQFESVGHMQSDIEKALLGLIKEYGAWDVVWGPVVWKVHPLNILTGPDNVWYVAYNTTINTYVVAIAGSATYSAFDSLKEDGDVGKSVDLMDWINSGLTKPFKPLNGSQVKDGAKAYISVGTASGVQILLSNAAPTSAHAPGTYLGDFLATIPASSTLIFTGHSLGGALSPTLALAWWKSSMSKKVQLSNVKTYPSAGPTPGNLKFVESYEEMFPPPSIPNPTGYQHWNVNLVNTSDVIPQAWCTSESDEPDQNIHRIPDFYDGTSYCKSVLRFALALPLAISADTSNLTYRPIKKTTFTGAVWPVSHPSELDSSSKGWLTDALFEHLKAYQQFVGIVDSSKALQFAEVVHEEDIGKSAIHWPILREIVCTAQDPRNKEKLEAAKLAASLEESSYGQVE